MGKRNVDRGTIDSLDAPMLFDLSSDIEEKNDVALNYPEKVRELEIIADKWRTELGDRNVYGNDEHPLKIKKEKIIPWLK